MLTQKFLLHEGKIHTGCRKSKLKLDAISQLFFNERLRCFFCITRVKCRQSNHGKRAYPSLVKTVGGLLRKKRSCPGKVSALGAGKAAQKKKEEDFVHWTSFFDYSKEKEEEQQIDWLGWPCDGEATIVSSMEKGPVSVVCMLSSASIAKALEEVKTSKAALFL
jgi:hypothetical protein